MQEKPKKKPNPSSPNPGAVPHNEPNEVDPIPPEVTPEKDQPIEVSPKDAPTREKIAPEYPKGSPENGDEPMPEKMPSEYPTYE